uniref:Uncharacterized protein n=1 Tax=Candidatus Methanogaster sp. ANME-2c ERB4 TaxID=2759911 RepID=A0A7G9Y1K7_9EURY|nr:hypothetical protein CIMACIEH_00006 [Methanosarcinales archaeon ANME-2c ERB4]
MIVCEPTLTLEIVTGVVPSYASSMYTVAPDGVEGTEIEPVGSAVGVSTISPTTVTEPLFMVAAMSSSLESFSSLIVSINAVSPAVHTASSVSVESSTRPVCPQPKLRLAIRTEPADASSRLFTATPNAASLAAAITLTTAGSYAIVMSKLARSVTSSAIIASVVVAPASMLTSLISTVCADAADIISPNDDAISIAIPTFMRSMSCIPPILL